MDELLQKLKKNFSEAEFQELKAAYDFRQRRTKDKKDKRANRTLFIPAPL